MGKNFFINLGTILAGIGGLFLFLKSRLSTGDIQKSKTDIKPCKRPFYYCEIHRNGEVSPCCPDFLKYESSPGNIGKEDFDKIWNGKIFTDLRQRVLKGDYSMCNRDICCFYEPCSVSDIPPDYKKGPKDFTMSYDFECNYHCITCRDSVKVNTAEEMDFYEIILLPKIIKAAKNAETIGLLGAGDPLCSRHTRHLMRELVKNYPGIKIRLSTNGFLMNEKNLTELEIQNNIQSVSVSVDAVNGETYKKIIRTDGFDTVIKNLEMMAEWKKQGRIEWMTINFVVHLLNYKEMPEFVKLAQKLDVTALFTTYRPWQSAEFYKKYDEVAVFEPANEHYCELAEILHDPVFKDKKHCLLEPRLLDIANS